MKNVIKFGVMWYFSPALAYRIAKDKTLFVGVLRDGCVRRLFIGKLYCRIANNLKINILQK
jgi:hypothetical protein